MNGEENREAVERARRTIRDRWGSALGEKASEEFCLAFGPRATGFPVRAAAPGLETAAEGAPGEASIVLELTPPRETLEAASARDERARGLLASDAVRSALREIRDADRDLLVQAESILRDRRIRTVREEFLKTADPLRQELERTVWAFGAERRLEDGAPRGREPVAQVCWLNQTMRTRTDPRALADIADAVQVERVDLTRRVRLELRVTADTLDAAGFRERSSLDGAGVIVAVIDAEAARHPAYGDRLVHRENYTLETWGNPHRHGTAVAGIVAADGDGVRGVAPAATIYNYKVAATNRFLNADDFGGALALQQALEDGAHIANCSWGTGPATDGSSREARACDTAWALGLVIVKSAGNAGPGPGTLTTPADAEGVIVVGATSRRGTAVPDYSSRGPTGDGRARPHLVAPGGDDGDAIVSCLPEGGFGMVGSGTSYAAPHVSGILALLLDEDPESLPDDLRARLLGMCRPIDGFEDADQGVGLIGLAELP